MSEYMLKSALASPISALYNAQNELDYALIRVRRFDTISQGLLPKPEAETGERPYIRKSVWDTLTPYVKGVSREEVLLRRRRRVEAHLHLARQATADARKQARRQAWLETKRERRQIVAESKEAHDMVPRDMEGDGLFPSFSVSERFNTYAEVAAIPPFAFPPRHRPSPVHFMYCTCTTCALQRVRAQKAKAAFDLRCLKRTEKELKEAARRKTSNFLRRRRRHRNGRPTRVDYEQALRRWPHLRPDDYVVPEEEVEVAQEATEVTIPQIVITPPPPVRLTQDERDERAFEEARRYNERYSAHVYRATTTPVRDEGLREKLRKRILQVRIAAKRVTVQSVTTATEVLGKLWTSVETGEVDELEMQPLPRMYVEMESTDPGGSSASQASNVVLQEAAPLEAEVIGHKFGRLRKYCSTDITSVPNNTDRWYQIDKFQWSKTQSAGTELAAYRLPHDAIYKKKTKATDTLTMKSNVLTNELRIRQYMATDIVVRVQLNSTPFHIGQALIAWFYQLDEDRFGKYRRHNVTMSQAHHVLLDVATSNSCEILIPYRNFRTYMNIYPNTELAPEAYLGTLIINVLNPLGAQDCSSPEVNAVVSVRFSDCELMGMIPPTIASRKEMQSEMFSTIMALEAAKYVRQYLADRNRDQPPAPHQPPYVVPTAVGSICTGTNDVEPVLPMRLDAIGQTPHPEPNDDEFTVRNLCSKFCYLFTKQIKSTDNAESKVVCLEAGPIFSLSDYDKVVIDGTDCYYIPPISVLSQLYSYWRGDIEFRLDFVCTRFHQMRLWICWVPAYLGDLTYTEALSCAGTMFDLTDQNRSTIITVPYIADRPWWGHKYSNGVDKDTTEAPSKFCVYIANPLMYNCNITKYVEMNIYVRGGSNFELAVPCQPTIGLGFHAAFQNNTDEYTTAYPGYFPWYAGVWRNLEGGDAGILRYGGGSDHIAQFVALKPHAYYTFKDPVLAESMKFKTTFSNPDMTGKDCVFVPVDVGDGYGFRYLGVMLYRPNVAQDIQKLRDYFCKLNASGTWEFRSKPDYDQLVLMGPTSSNTLYTGSTNAVLLETEFQLPTKTTLTDWEAMSSEAPTENLIGNVKFEVSASGSASMSTFGESHMDLKDMCRRYQLYHMANILKPTPVMAEVDYTFPLLPQGLSLDPMQSAIQNFIRDGVIPILLSGYRFYRGGLRFKIIPSVTDYITYAVQIRPDRRLVHAHARARGVTVADSMYQHGYATSMQATSVNPVMTIEVPFYLPGNVGLLQRPSAQSLNNKEVSRFYSLGELCLNVGGYTAGKLNEVQFTIMYSVADDFSPYEWQGFPPMCFIKDAKLDS